MRSSQQRESPFIFFGCAGTKLAMWTYISSSVVPKRKVWYGTHCANSWPDRAASDLGRQAQDVSQCRHCITRSDKLSLFPPGLTPRVPLSWSPTSNNLVYKNDVHWSCGTRLPSDFQLLMLCFKCCLTWVLTMSMPYFASLLDTS